MAIHLHLNGKKHSVEQVSRSIPGYEVRRTKFHAPEEPKLKPTRGISLKLSSGKFMYMTEHDGLDPDKMVENVKTVAKLKQKHPRDLKDITIPEQFGVLEENGKRTFVVGGDIADEDYFGKGHNTAGLFVETAEMHTHYLEDKGLHVPMDAFEPLIVDEAGHVRPMLAGRGIIKIRRIKS